MTAIGDRTTGAAPAARTVRRLRPGVAVTPLRAGLHLRGRDGSVTLEGSTALPALWRWLEGPLRDGGLDGLLDATEAGPRLRTAVRTLLGRLEAHGLLMTEPAGYEDQCAGDHGRDPVALWLRAGAARPAAARAALAAARAEVLAGDPDGPLARAAARALALGALPVTRTADPALPAGRVLLRLHGTGPVRALAAGLRAGGGYATAPGSPAQARSDAAALEARLGPGDGDGDGSPALASLLGGAAAHRLLCAAAGLPDPAAEGGDDRLLPGLPAVLLAEAAPPRAEYRTWLGPGRLDTDRRTDLPPAGTLGEALRRLAALGDEWCGALPAPLPADLRQLPVPLAACGLPGEGPAGGRLVAGAPRLDLARLEVFCRAAELLLGGPGFTVGANPGHARGRALRAAFARRAADDGRAAEERAGAVDANGGGTPAAPPPGGPAARMTDAPPPGPAARATGAPPSGPTGAPPACPGDWPTGAPPAGAADAPPPGPADALPPGPATRMTDAPPSGATGPTGAPPPRPTGPPPAGGDAGRAVPVAAPLWAGHPQFRHWWHTLTARLEVPARLEVLRAGPDGVYHAVVRRAGGPAPVLGEAVEATPGDAAAFAALAAVAAVRTGRPGPGRTPPSGGAVAPLACAGVRTAGWEDAGWTGRWLADAAGREEAFQDALRRLAGPPPATGAPAPVRDPALLARLRAFGFTVLHTPEEPS
ncbi:hypothetical protein ACFY7H_12345 [Streptomyces sp. NPDC012794]|uniref:hypothetical protein n=1 Tax=Streptomyces sp. NPDC012794 TaxID=3364850 RepID=UPI00367BAA1C